MQFTLAKKNRSLFTVTVEKKMLVSESKGDRGRQGGRRRITEYYNPRPSVQ